MRQRQVALLPVMMTALALVLACASGGLARISAGPGPLARASQPSQALLALTVRSPDGRILRPGMSGTDVRKLQRRLAFLKYYPGPVDGRFGPFTLEAVWAFQEVQGLPTQDQVGPQMQQALAHPRPPAVLVPGGGPLRIEVNLSHEVLVLYQDNKVALISHVSTGGGYYYCSPGGGCGYAITPTGNFTTDVFMPGWVKVALGQMYNPVFFIDTTYAIHGDTNVPLQPVSHGCVRLPMDIGAFFHTLIAVPGTPVYIRG